MKENAKSAELREEFEAMDEYERRVSNITAQGHEELRALNRQRKRAGKPPLEGYPDGYK